MPPQNRLATFVRWLLVLPVAYIASWFFGGVFTYLLLSSGIDLRGPAYPAFVFPLLQLLPGGIAFTLVGGLVAPDWKSVTAIVLATFWLAVSLTTHVLGQSNPGLTNYMHTSGESLGALIGIALIARRMRKTQPASDPEESAGDE